MSGTCCQLRLFAQPLKFNRRTPYFPYGENNDRPITGPQAATFRSLACRCLARKQSRESSHESDQPVKKEEITSRRAALAAGLATPAAAALAALSGPALTAPPAAAADALTVEELFPGASQGATDSEGQLKFTHRVYLDIGTCTAGARQDRRLGDKSVLCSDPDPVGRIIIGLYGTVAPQTVSNFVEAVKAGSFSGTLINKVLPGQYIAAGRQGSHRLGYVEAPLGLPTNSDILSPSAFQLRHLRPGTVSLNLSANEDDDFKFDKDYRNLSFLITTGPGPVPSLDGQSIVMGQVIEGLDVVTAIAAVPTFGPNQRVRAFNELASVLGDDRASKARATWSKPIAPVVITDAGVLS